MTKKYLLYVLVLSLAISASAFADNVNIAIAGGDEEVQSFDKNGVTYFSFSEFAEIIGGMLDWETVGQIVYYKIDTTRFDFLLGSAYFKLGDSVYNMVYPAEYQQGQLYLPAETFIPFLDGVISEKISWAKEKKLVRVDSEYFNVTDLTVSRKANGLLIELYLTSSLAYDVFITEGNWINISVRDGKVNRTRMLSRLDRRLMHDLKVHQLVESGQVSIRMRRKINNWHHKLVYGPPRIQISIEDADFEIDETQPVASIGPDSRIDVIVIDPGHGGEDYGAIGPKGTREKDVALDIAKELAKLIRKDKQFKVIMTRDRDKTITLQDRARIANESSADLFISIHANANLKDYVRGWNVFFLAPAKNDSARAVAQFENSAFLREQAQVRSAPDEVYTDSQRDPVLNILNEMIMTEFQEESHDFAMILDREFRSISDVPARGVDQAGFYVLNSVYTPSVLIETGFISNPVEEKILTSRGYRKEMVEAIYDSIKRFKAKYESR
ncbi:MAG TPA: N-acetylmuramoyl-L-alanine amidase [candidate division Zixibacteria bacterium]|nr:N-acetylmuramoyl-L-alanine amidase [candidate division Zixibacteria bacterium]